MDAIHILQQQDSERHQELLGALTNLGKGVQAMVDEMQHDRELRQAQQSGSQQGQDVLGLVSTLLRAGKYLLLLLTVAPLLTLSAPLQETREPNSLTDHH
jgi:hypothetical protein